MLGDVNKLFVFKSLLTTSSNGLSFCLKQTFPPIIWIFTEGEGDEIESRLPFKIFSTLTLLLVPVVFSCSFSFLNCFEECFLWVLGLIVQKISSNNLVQKILYVRKYRPKNHVQKILFKNLIQVFSSKKSQKKREICSLAVCFDKI